MITHDGLNNLALEIGSEAWALVKASWIMLALPVAANQLSARNQLLGKIIKIVQGAVNAEVVLQLAGGNTVSAIITNDSVGHLALAEGVDICAVFKASSVILGVTD